MNLKLPMFFCLITISSYAQLDVKFNTVRLLDKRPEVALEMGYDKFSIELSNGFIFKKWGEVTIIDDKGEEISLGVKRRGYDGSLRANFYFKPKNSLDGWHVSPILRYKTQNVQFEDPIKNRRLGTGLIIGRKGSISDDFGYQTEIGFGYWFVNKYKSKAGSTDSISSNIPFIGDLLSGYDKFMLPIGVTVYYRIGND